jgi:D-alanyl-D-alanine carboxypeptidase (penicillin-binding protein 5/6)
VAWTCRRLPVLLTLLALLAPFVAAAAAAAPAAPREESAAALLMEAATGEILYAEHPDREWIPASVVKLMLMLLTQEAIEAGRVAVTDVVTASPRAQAQGGSQVYLSAGEQVTLQRLLEAIAVGSANDATMALAEHIFGSAEAAVAAMNERAALLGMSTTHYVNVTGLPERGRPDNRSCARDQARLAREVVLRSPGVLAWTRLTETEFRPGLRLHCTNVLLKRCPGVDGLKTGYHGKARFNLVVTAEREGRRLIAVVMGSPSAALRNRVATRLLERGFQDWQLVTGLQAGAGFGAEFPVAGGWRATVPVLAAQTLQFSVTPAQAERVRIQLAAGARLAAPLKAGEVVGQIQATVDGRLLASVPAVAGRGVSRRWFGKGDAASSTPWPELPARASARGREP